MCCLCLLNNNELQSIYDFDEKNISVYDKIKYCDLGIPEFFKTSKTTTSEIETSKTKTSKTETLKTKTLKTETLKTETSKIDITKTETSKTVS